jgi:alkylation response protein AidB-like acyl-CoA dehydrogenase
MARIVRDRHRRAARGRCDLSEFALPEDVEQLRLTVARFVERDLAPDVRRAEVEGQWPKEALAVLDGFSLGALDLPARLGGEEVGCLAKVVVLEEIAKGDAGGLPAADQPGRAAGALIACPDETLAKKIAGACLSGDAQCAFVVGDDVGEPRVQWTPSWPSLTHVFVSDGDVLRLVEIDVGTEPALALAFHASGGISVALRDAKILGEWELDHGDAVSVRGRARIWAAAVAVGVAQAAFDATITYTTDRIVFGKPVAHHQGNAFELSAAAARLQAARLFVRDAARRFDADDANAGFWATQAWLETIDTAFVVTDLGIQLLGGHGFLEDHLAEKRFREARMLGLLHGGRDSAIADVADLTLDVPDSIFVAQELV